MSKLARSFARSHAGMARRTTMILSRREFLKTFARGAVAAVGIPALLRIPVYAAETAEGKVLILYFSHFGHTSQLAEYIHARVGGDIVEVKTVVPYSQDYGTMVDRAQKEQQSDARPEISTEIPNLEEYDTVFIGFPIWWDTLPMAFFTLLEKYPLGDKTVIPFCTHGGSRFGRSESDLNRLCPRARFLRGFEVRDTWASLAQGNVDAWLSELGFPAR